MLRYLWKPFSLAFYTIDGSKSSILEKSLVYLLMSLRIYLITWLLF